VYKQFRPLDMIAASDALRGSATVLPPSSTTNSLSVSPLNTPRT
jgi:hypothetical protein